LDKCADVVAFAKNSLALGFRLDYVNAEGDLSYYYPDFFVKCGDKQLVLVETKGLETKDVPLKMARLRQWCEDVNQVQQDQHFDFVYVEEERFVRYQPQSFHELMENFSTHKEPHVQA
jgi:type III restriction enzyme